MAEDGEDVVHAALEHAFWRGQLAAALVLSWIVQVVDQLAHHAFAAAPVVAPVGGDDALVEVVRHAQRHVGLDGEQGVKASAAALCQVLGAGEQGAPAVVEPVVLDAAPAGGLPLQPAAHHGEPAGGQIVGVQFGIAVLRWCRFFGLFGGKGVH